MKAPKELSEGEETLALHLRANKIDFEREVCPIPGRKWRVDFMIGQLAIEVEGLSRHVSRHSTFSGYREDCRKYNALTLAGFAVLRYTTEMVIAGDAIRDIMKVMGVNR